MTSLSNIRVAKLVIGVPLARRADAGSSPAPDLSILESANAVFQPLEVRMSVIDAAFLQPV